MSELLAERDAPTVAWQSPSRFGTIDSRHLSGAAANLLVSMDTLDPETIAWIEHDFDYADRLAMQLELGTGFFGPNSSIKLCSWLKTAGPQDVRTFSTWEDERVALLQNALDQDSKDLQDSAVNYMEHLTDLGMQPKFAIDALYHSIKEVPVKALGSLESHGRLGYFLPDSDEIWLANRYDNTTMICGLNDEMYATHFHERDHSDHTESPLPVFLDEAITEHRAVVATAVANKRIASPEIINPDRRLDVYEGASVLERRALGIFANAAAVTPGLLFSSFNQGSDSNDYRSAIKKFNRFFQKITGRVEGFNEFLADYENATTSRQQAASIHTHLKLLH